MLLNNQVPRDKCNRINTNEFCRAKSATLCSNQGALNNSTNNLKLSDSGMRLLNPFLKETQNYKFIFKKHSITLTRERNVKFSFFSTNKASGLFFRDIEIE